VFAKLGVNNRTSAALLAVDYDVAPPPDRLARRRRLVTPDPAGRR